MKRGLGAQAYTIIEVMIVLVVTSALLVSAILLIAGQQRKTEFGQAVRDIESRINDTVNDVSTGFYPNTGNFTCISLGSGPIISAGGNNQGANQGCIFIGRVMQFAVLGTNNEGYNSYTVVGQRVTSSNQQVTNFAQAHPTAVAPSSSSSSVPDATQTGTLLYGLKAASMYIINADDSHTPIGAFGVFSTFANSGTQPTGTTSVDLIPLGNSLGVSQTTMVDTINTVNDATSKNPAKGIAVCFNSGGTDQHAIITIGANQGRITTNSVIDSGSCS